jgi:hypothetical protein
VKHLVLAVALIASSICLLEVGLRAHRLHQVYGGKAVPQDRALVRPCPLTYQHLLVHYDGAYRSKETASDVSLTTNALGLRGDEVTLPKPLGTFRIVCLGDDATLALDIEADNTFCSRLEGILQPNFEAPVEVINAGQPGYCPLLGLAWARWRLVGLQPDLVILCCDVSDVGDDRHVRPLANFDTSGTLLWVSHPAAADRTTDMLTLVEREFVLARLLSGYLGDRIGTSTRPFDFSSDGATRSDTSSNPVGDHPAASVEQTWDPLRELQSLCRSIPSEFVVVVVPSTASVRSASANGGIDGSDPVAELLTALVDRTNHERIPLLDASAEFARNRDRSRMFLKSSGALSADGHRQFAEILGQALLERQPSQSQPQTLPVSGESPETATPLTPPETATALTPPETATPLTPSDKEAPLTPTPLRTLERRPRQPGGSPD